MSTELIREPRHLCDLPYNAGDGEIRECSTCLRRWVFRVFGNPYYTGWRRTNANWLGGRWLRLVALRLRRDLSGVPDAR